MPKKNSKYLKKYHCPSSSSESDYDKNCDEKCHRECMIRGPRGPIGNKGEMGHTGSK